MSGSNSGQTANSSSWVIVDDWRRLVNGGGWNRQTNAENAFNGTLSTLRGSRFNDNTTSYVQPPSFRGREIMLVGRPSEDLRMGYSIFYSADGSVYAVNEPAQVNTSASVVGKDGAVIWRLDNIPVPSLESDGSFPVIRVYPTQGDLHLDYVAYRLASEEVERLDNVLLDDTHPYIEYDAREADVFIRDDNASTPIGFPLNGTWTRSNRAGSSFTTRFKGAFNVAVYGVLRHTRGTLSLNYTLDNGVTETKNYFDSTQAANATKWSFQKLYEHSFPRDQRFKNHKLEVTLAACTDDQTFYLDYITYQASDHQQSTIPPSESDIGGDDDRGFSKASIGAIVGAIVGFIFFIAVSFRFVKLRRWQIQKRNAAQSGLNYQEPRSYALQALEQRRRQDEMMGPDHRVPDPPPPWTPPANPDGAPPPPEFEPPPASDLFPMPTPRVRLASTIAPGPALEAPPVFESRPSSPAPSAPSETQPTVTNVLQGGRGPGSQGGTLVHSGGGTQAAQATNDIPAPPATPPRSNTS